MNRSQPSIARYLTPSQAAKRLNVTLQEVAGLNLKPVNRAGNIYYSIKEVNKLVDKQRAAFASMLDSSTGQPNYLSVLFGDYGGGSVM